MAANNWGTPGVRSGSDGAMVLGELGGLALGAGRSGLRLAGRTLGHLYSSVFSRPEGVENEARPSSNASSPQKRVALLIGPTGQGKSTAGSYLVNPDNSELDPTNPPCFPPGHSNDPFTQAVSSAGVEIDVVRSMEGTEPGRVIIEIIDTPGLDEAPDADLEHMYKVFMKLQEQGSLSAIVLCFSASSRITESLRIILGFYHRLFKELMYTNFFVIMTNVQMDLKSRPARDYDEGKIKNLEAAIKGIMQTTTPITILKLDGCPGKDEGEQDIALQRRQVVLEKIASLPLVDVTRLQFAKLPQMIIHDRKQAAICEARIDGYIMHQESTSKLLGEAVRKVQTIDGDLRRERGFLDSTKSQLDNLNNVSEVEVDNVAEQKYWKFGLTPHACEILLKSKYPIHRVSKTALRCVTVELNPITYDPGSKMYLVKGSAKGGWILGFVRGFEVNVTAYAAGVDFHAARIESLSAKQQQLEEKVATLEGQLATQMLWEENFAQELKLLQELIDKHEQERKAYERDYLPLDQVLVRVAELRGEKLTSTSNPTHAMEMID